MIDVFGFLTARTIKNRFVRRLRRLREPRYLIPTAVSVLWLGFWMSNALLRGGSRPAGMWSAFAGDGVRDALALVGALLLFAWTAFLWLVPSGKVALEFTPAEIHFLFPAPVTRRQIVHYKLFRAQVGILFGALITSFFWGRGLAHVDGWARLAGFWLLYATLHLHTLGAGFVRTDLIEQGVPGLRRRLLPLGLLVVFVAGAVVGVAQAWPDLAAAAAGITAADGHWSRRGLAEFVVAVGQVGKSGVLGVFLAPFTVFPHVVLAHGAADFARWFAWGVALLLVHYVWVIRSDTAFEEASVEAAQKRAARIAVRRDTARRGGRLPGRARPFPWRLAPTGRPGMAIAWKNLVSLSRVVPMRALVVAFAFMVAAFGWTVGRSDGSTPWALIVSVLLVFLALFTVLFGPVFLRNDLREDLFHVDAVKTFPLSGQAVVRGELFAPWSVLAALQVGILAAALAALLSAGPSGLGQLGLEEPPSLAWCLAGFAAAAIALPAITLAQLVLQNALVLMFPAWVALGNSRARGFEASGQRMLTLFGSMIVLGVCTLPAVAAGGILAWILSGALGALALAAGAGLAAAVIYGEVAVATVFLGRMLDRLDPSTAGIESQDD